MNDQNRRTRPLLSKYEVEIPRQPKNCRVEYDEEAMILTVDGHPVINQPILSTPPRPTRVTFVGQETTDDD